MHILETDCQGRNLLSFSFSSHRRTPSSASCHRSVVSVYVVTMSTRTRWTRRVIRLMWCLRFRDAHYYFVLCQNQTIVPNRIIPFYRMHLSNTKVFLRIPDCLQTLEGVRRIIVGSQLWWGWYGDLDMRTWFAIWILCCSFDDGWQIWEKLQVRRLTIIIIWLEDNGDYIQIRVGMDWFYEQSVE